MHVDQKQVTTVNMNDGKARDFVLLKDGHGYKLTAVARDEVVSLLLTPRDLHKLRQEVASHAIPDETHSELPLEECIRATLPVERAERQYDVLDWLSFN
jgi:hypothetical protein